MAGRFRVRYILILFVAMTASALMIFASACGRTKEEATDADSADALNEDFVYVAEFAELEGLQDINIYSAKFVGDSLYCAGLEFDGNDAARRFIGEYSLTAKQMVRKLPVADWNGEIRDFQVADDGSVYVLYYDYNSGVLLLAFDGQENLSWQMNLRDEWQVTSVNQRIAVDQDDHVCVFLTDRMMVLDADGVLQWEMSLAGIDNHVENAGFGRDGKMYISYSRNPGGEFVLTEIDFEERKLGAVCENYSWGRGMTMVAGAGYDVLLSEEDGLYGYDCGTQSVSKILSWTDYGLNGGQTGAFDYMENGEIRALFCGSAGKTELAVLKKCAPEEVPVKQEIVIATFQTWPDIQAAVASFNRHSANCHVTIREYTFEFGRFSDAVEKLNIDMISKDKCPDIICLDESLNVKAFAKNGVFEDLYPYLEQSDVLAAEDYPQNILEGYTFGGVLTGIPYSFHLDTIVGRGADVGDEPGWTTDEMIAFAQAHSDAGLFHDAYNRTVLNACLRFGESDFTDWTEGRAYFDSPEFKRQLSFAAGFPELDYRTLDYSAERIMNGEVLLCNARISEVWDIQIYDALYEGDAVYVGYPTADGSNGCRLVSTNAYGIAAASEHREEAWDFLEFFLNGEPEDWSVQELLSNNRARMASATDIDYVRNYYGELFLDTEGRPVKRHDGELHYNGMRMEYHSVTEEEIALLESLVETARIVSTSDERISAIIREETEAFFQGQVSVDDAAAMIQNRVQLYLDEN